jgi:hypothetical protein
MSKQKENFYRFSQTLNSTSGEFGNILKNKELLSKFKKNLNHLSRQIDLVEFQNEIASTAFAGKNYSDTQNIYFKDLMNDHIQRILSRNNKLYEPLIMYDFLIKSNEEQKAKELQTKKPKENDLIKNRLIFDDENLLNSVSEILEEKFDVEIDTNL